MDESNKEKEEIGGKEEEKQEHVSSVLVEFVVMPESQTFEHRFTPHQTTAELRQTISTILETDEKVVSLQIAGTSIDETHRVVDLLSTDQTYLCINVFIDYPNDQTATVTKTELVTCSIGPTDSTTSSKASFPSSVKVTIDSSTPETPSHQLQIQLSNESFYRKKLYLGGYRHRRSGIIYHHATCQTYDLRALDRMARASQLNHRTTQTKKVLSRHQQTKREQSTQMDEHGRNLFISKTTDRVVESRPYVSSEQVFEVWHKKAIIIQCFVRCVFARRRARALLHQRYEREDAATQAERTRLRQEEEHRRGEVERRMHPKSRQDFQILREELETWRLHETNRIKLSSVDPQERHEQLRDVLYKETKLLQTIERLKIAADQEGQDQGLLEKLIMMAAPKRFQLPTKKELIDIETPTIERARYLTQLYTGLRLPNLSIDERLDVLLHVKWTVREFEAPLTHEIVELIDREADLLNRGRAPSSVAGLRRRLSNLFYHFVTTPEYNPEASRFQSTNPLST